MNKTDFIKLIPTLKQISVIFAGTTRMPMVFCHEETMDDYIKIYLQAEEASVYAKELAADKQPAFVVNCKEKEILPFFVELRLIGVNAVCFVTAKASGGEQFMVQLQEFLKLPDYSKLPAEKQPVENTSLHLSMLYFMQEMRKPVEHGDKRNLKELEEEASAGIARGRFLVPCREVAAQEANEDAQENGSTVAEKDDGTRREADSREGKAEKRTGIIMLKNEKGESFLPLFTDGGELRKFLKAQKCPVMVLTFPVIADMIARGNAAGILINPSTSNVTLSKEGVAAVSERFWKWESVEADAKE